MRRRFSVFFIFLAITFLMSSLLFTVKHKALANEVGNMIFTNGIKSKSAILLDEKSNKVIFSHNENEKRPIASMCKIMTLLLCFESIDDGLFNENDSILVSENASKMGGSQVFLEGNTNYLVSTLIKSIVVASANDACVAMSEQISGSEEEFVNKMNDRAKELGMNNTVFTNCTGLPKAGQYSTALDVSIMFRELLKHKNYFNYSNVWMDKVEHPEGRFTEISNTNKLIRFYDGCDSGKTGYTAEAGHCLCASASKNGMRLISVVISSPDSKTRFNEVSTMFNYGFNNYVNKLIIDNNIPLSKTLNVNKGEKDYLEVIAEKPIYSFTKKTDKTAYEIIVKENEKITAPVIKGELVGEVLVYEKGELIYRVNLLANEDIEVKSYSKSLTEVIDNWGL